MKQFIEITRTSGPVCVGLPSRKIVDGYNPANMNMTVRREGSRTTLAIYPARQEEGGQMCFLIDDDLVDAHSGWYVGTIYNCNKPIHSVRMFVPRPKFGAASVQRMKPDCSPIKVPECPPSTCPPGPLVSENGYYIAG